MEGGLLTLMESGDKATLHAVNADTGGGGKAAFDMDDTIPFMWMWRLWPGTRLADHVNAETMRTRLPSMQM